MKIKKIMLRETLSDFIPTIIGLFFWIGIAIIGTTGIKKAVGVEDPLYALVLTVWLIACLNLTRIIPPWPATYEEIEEDENE